MTTVAEKYLQIAKLAKDPANAEVVIDGILTFFGLDYFDLDLLFASLIMSSAVLRVFFLETASSF